VHFSSTSFEKAKIMQTGPTRAVQAEIISYLMAQILVAPAVQRERLFVAVKSALNIWIVGAACDMRTQAARNVAEAGFGGRVREYLTVLSRHSPRSPEWLKQFQALKAAFEEEASRALTPSEEDVRD